VFGEGAKPNSSHILVKFRKNPIGLVADIEKAFHHIVVDKPDYDLLLFLWFDDISKDKPEIVQF